MQRLPITLETLLHADRTLFQLCPGDEETPADITIAELKELVVAINTSNERIQGLYHDLLEAEERIEQLESRLLAKGKQDTAAETICARARS